MSVFFCLFSCVPAYVCFHSYAVHALYVLIIFQWMSLFFSLLFYVPLDIFVLLTIVPCTRGCMCSSVSSPAFQRMSVLVVIQCMFCLFSLYSSRCPCSSPCSPMFHRVSLFFSRFSYMYQRMSCRRPESSWSSTWQFVCSEEVIATLREIFVAFFIHTISTVIRTMIRCLQPQLITFLRLPRGRSRCRGYLQV